MSAQNFTAQNRPTFVIALAVTVCVIMPLVVSSQQAGQFFRSLGTGDGNDATVMFLAACSIIFSSPVIAVLIGYAVSVLHRRLGVGVCALIMAFSIITTTIAINNKTGSKIAEETQASATSQTLQSTIDGNLATVASLQEQIDARDPQRWATKRGEWSSQIQMLQMQNMELIRQQRDHAESGAGSVTGETFERLAEYGITRFGFAVFAATLLDLIPFVVCLIIGSMLARAQREYGRGQGRTRDETINIDAEQPATKKHQPWKAAA